jgi:hypothetical protein
MKKIMILLVLAAGLMSLTAEDPMQILLPGRGIENYVTVGATTKTEITTKFGTAYKEEKHYTTAIGTGTRQLFSIERSYARQGISFYFYPDRDTVFCIRVRAPYKAKTDKGIIAGTSTMRDVRKAYGAAEFYTADNRMMLEYPGIKFYCASAASEEDALSKKVDIISIVKLDE